MVQAVMGSNDVAVGTATRSVFFWNNGKGRLFGRATLGR